MLFFYLHGKLSTLMKNKRNLLILAVLLLAVSCATTKPTNSETSSENSSETSFSSEENISSEEKSSSKPEASSTSSSQSGPQKVTVAAHTLKDANSPIDPESMGQVVSESTWNSFRNASTSKFNGNYNYTYTAYSGGSYTLEKFTKNGYYIMTSSGTLYYERKSGNTFYNYISVSDGYLRQETTLDIQEKYTYRIQHEISVHMFDFSNYEYDDYDGTYYYRTTSFGAAVRFQGGYLTFLSYALGMNVFNINASFETTIDIPASYYYK